MKFFYYFPGRWVPHVPELLSVEAHAAQTTAAAAAGFIGVSTDEHPIPSEPWRNGPGGHDALDPFVVLGAVAASAPDMKLLTYLAVVPFRNPFLLAKQAATLDVLSGGRLILGVGTGYQEPEFQALGVDFDERNALFDEGLEVMKLAWTGEPVSYRGAHFRAEQVRARPTPVARPHPPLWIGGNSRLTMRRVVDSAQGWMPMPNARDRTRPGRSVALESLDDLARLKSYMDRYAAEQGRTAPIEILCSLTVPDTSPAEVIDHLGRLEEIGVGWVSAGGRSRCLAEALEWIDRFGAEVIAPCSAR
ncbi:MAG: LLM class F420-dependent oxidoreductase [Actinomycetota bacterium]|nr:LLM class F420-dependent oxidoreductase [Actinomycetota bacterium]